MAFAKQPVKDGKPIKPKEEFYFLKETFSDVNIIIGSHTIPAHKNILGSKCPYFEALFLANPNQAEFMVSDVSLEIFKCVLQYIYTGDIVLPTEVNLIIDVIKLAGDYSLQSLENTLSKEIKCILNEDNVCMILNSANLYDFKKIREVCHDFLDEYVPEMSDENFLNQLSQKSMIKFLERDSLPLVEIEVFKLAQKWIEVNEDEDNLVLNCVQWSSLGNKDIVDIVRPSKLVDNEKMIELMTNLLSKPVYSHQYRLGYKIRKGFASHTLSKDLKKSLKFLGLSKQALIETKIDAKVIQKVEFDLNKYIVCRLLNVANLYDLDDLRRLCHEYMDTHAFALISSDSLNKLTQESMVGLLERDSFPAPEVEIVKIVAKWYAINPNADDSVMKCVRLSTMSVEDIVSVVWPLKLTDPEKLLEIIAEITGVKKTDSKPKPRETAKKFEKPKKNEHTHSTLSRGYELNAICHSFEHHLINDPDGIIIDLRHKRFINHIEISPHDHAKWTPVSDKRFYSYYIEVSEDKENWHKVVDYSKFPCRSLQDLYFDPQLVRFVKLVGTKNSDGEIFKMRRFGASFKTDIPQMVNEIIRPKSNVAILDEKAIAIEGNDWEYLLSDSGGWTYHIINEGQIVVQLSQPYMISNLEFSLGERYEYSYFIETSTDKIDWQMVADCRSGLFKGKQIFCFEERPVVFIRITGTESTSPNNFSCKELKCPATEGQKE